jgi:hypothetical protein
MKRLLLVFSLVLPSGCFFGDGLDYDELHVSATRSDGTLATSVPQNGCITLPLLLGSRTEQTITIASQIVVDVSATRDRARVRISGLGVSEHRTILAEDLRRQTYSEEIVVNPESGQIFTLRLRSSCPVVSVPDG